VGEGVGGGGEGVVVRTSRPGATDPGSLAGGVLVVYSYQGQQCIAAKVGELCGGGRGGGGG